jgi:G:T-mismatch repair DNA endonuclease (very short patch repair protein)
MEDNNSIDKVTELISDYSKTRDHKIYYELCKLIPENKNCRLCQLPIWFPRSLIRFDRLNKRPKFDLNSPTCMSYKKVNGIDYQLSLCYMCLSDKLPDVANLNKSRIFNTLNKYSSLAYLIPEKEISDANSKKVFSLKKSIEKYGEIEGNAKWESYVKFQSDKNKYEYKNIKYGWTVDQFNEFNRSRAVTLDNLKNKHGEERGNEIYEGYVKKQQVNGSKLEWFVLKYGEEEGTKKLMDVNYSKITNNHSKNGFYSRVSQEFFLSLDEHLNEYKTMYATKDDGEFVVKIQELGIFYKLDFYIPDLKIAIEFNGDFYHANPEKYKNPDEILKIFKKRLSVKEIWDKDIERTRNLYQYAGIKVIVVWEKDYMNNRKTPEFYKEIIKKII